MKTLFVLLLGFGGVFPIACGKSDKKQSERKTIHYQLAWHHQAVKTTV